MTNTNEEQISQLKKRRNGILTRNRILSVSACLFAREGFDSVSIRQIAKQTGIKEGSVYNHFINKQEILKTLIDEFAAHYKDFRPDFDQLEALAETANLPEILKLITQSMFYNGDEFLMQISIILQYERFRWALAADAYQTFFITEPIGYHQRLFDLLLRKYRINPNATFPVRPYVYAVNGAYQEYCSAKNGLGDMNPPLEHLEEIRTFYCGFLEFYS